MVRTWFCFLAVVIGLASKSLALTYPIVDTGVEDFSSDTSPIRPPLPGQPFYGQDANYHGTSWSYLDNGNGSVSDLVTGLMWQKTPTQMTYDNAVNSLRNFQLGGYSDWRIPTIKELYSLILFDGNTNGIEAGSMSFINTDFFDQPFGYPRQIDAQTLSANIYTGLVLGLLGNEECIFGVNFIDGRIKCYPRYGALYFRFVRGNPNYGLNKFVQNGDGTISDQATGLMWMKTDSGRTMNWRSALLYCENLTFSGHNDWRLPNIKELQSIVDYSRGPQTTHSPAINAMFQVTQIQEPDGTMDYPYFWFGTTHHDGPMPQSAAYIAFGQGWGRPGQSGRLVDVHGAGCQRSDPKSAGRETYPQYMGPQGDMRTVYNYARCVRTI